ncbi:MAG: hypothetical protein WCG28_02695, partial [bacterium]
MSKIISTNKYFIIIFIFFFSFIFTNKAEATGFTIGGTVSGLSGTVILQNNGVDNYSTSTNGSFTFVTAINDGSTYNVTVLTQPSGQTCTVANSSGTVPSGNVTNVTVSCIDSKILFFDDFERGDFSAWDGTDLLNGLIGSTLVVQQNMHSGLYSFQSQARNPGASKILMGSSPTVPLRCDSIIDGPDNNLSPGYSTCGTPSNYTELSMRFYMQVGSDWTMPANASVNIAIFSGETLRLTKVGSSYYLKDAGNRLGTHAIDGAWHAIEIHSKACSTNPCTTNDGVIQVYIDGVLDISTASATTLAPLGASTYLGLDNDATSVGSIYFDDVVVSTAPIGISTANITVRHPNTANRIGLPVDVVLFGQSPTDSLIATVDGNTVYQKTGSITSHEQFAITGMAEWVTGDHSLTVELRSTLGILKASYSDIIHKYKNGAPTVSIDENNTIAINGQNFFAVGLFTDGISNWNSYYSHGAVNSYCCGDAYQNNYAYSPSTLSTFLDILAPSFAIVPDGNWTGRGTSGGNSIRASSVSTAVSTWTSYITALKDKINLLAWTFGDEFDMGVGEGHTTVARTQALTDATHTNDPNHPVFVNFLGYEQTRVAVVHGRYAPIVPGSRDWNADIYSTDTYPIIYQVDPTLRNSIKNWVLYIDRLNHYTFGLAPIFQFIESGIDNRTSSAGCCNGPNGTQILMESWLGVIHGLKGINWWSTYVDVGSDPLGTSNNDQFSGMAQFVRQIGEFQNTILGGKSRAATSNQTTDGSRVDVSAWDSDTNTLVVAARLSEAMEPTFLLASDWTQTTCNGSAHCYYTAYSRPLAGVGNSVGGDPLTNRAVS